jgi:hypothetical protein
MYLMFSVSCFYRFHYKFMDGIIFGYLLANPPWSTRPLYELSKKCTMELDAHVKSVATLEARLKKLETSKDYTVSKVGLVNYEGSVDRLRQVGSMESYFFNCASVYLFLSQALMRHREQVEYVGIFDVMRMWDPFIVFRHLNTLVRDQFSGSVLKPDSENFAQMVGGTVLWTFYYMSNVASQASWIRSPSRKMLNAFLGPCNRGKFTYIADFNYLCTHSNVHVMCRRRLFTLAYFRTW